MTTEETGRSNRNETISRKAYFFVALWATGILLFYILAGILGTNRMRKYKTETQEQRRVWVSSQMVGSAEATAVLPQSSAATPVAVSVLVNRAGDYSLRESTWVADFDISFRWKGDAIDPGSTFRIANGEILNRTKEVSATFDGERYERYNVKARIGQFIDPARFPFSDVGLGVAIEDPSLDAQVMRYQVDRDGIHLGPSAIGPELKAAHAFATVKLYRYQYENGTPFATRHEVYSRFVFGMIVAPRGHEIYIRMFQALFASVAIALVVFFIKPTFVDPRFGLGVGAFFAAVGNNIFLATLLPPANRVTLTDMVNLIGLVTIFLTLVQSTISLYFCDTDRWRLSRFFDRLCFPLFLLGYLVVDVLLPVAAKS